ncbi:MAG: PEP-CTERM sorting domain-containing protein [Deferribacteres bacterium]|nr:PEP-CTERM sorting domain-containing protein [Deferribacteres bacterium]
MFKSFFRIFIASLLFVGLSALPARALPTVSLNLMDTDIYVGESFDVQVLLDGDNINLELLAFGFDVKTTGSVFTYDGYKIETGFDDDSSWVPPGVAGSAFPGITYDDVLLATLSFTATDVGTGYLQALGSTDNLFYGLAYEIVPGVTGWYDINASLDVTVNSGVVAPVPEPSTIILTGIGLIGFVGFRRKFKKAS